ncbi:MAG: TolC family protein, partial [Gammaproteobacteria bacterium]|nr:TolC family protein [Gammaproteobacteria bacterium]
MRLSLGLAVAVGCALGGCSLAPRYQRPSTPAPAPAYQELGDWKIAAPADADARGAWWRMFHDADLDRLEAGVTSTNQSLKAALARLEEARAATRIARAGWFPTLTANASATRQRTSLNAPGVPPGAEPVYNNLIAAGELSYEIDL